MYEKLLLKAGGGIIDRVQQSTMDDAAVIAIGLGGTGADCLRHLKENLYNRVRPDDPKAAVPTYNRIRFLAVDSDAKDMRHHAETAAQRVDGALGELDLSTEFFSIAYPKKISALFQARRTNLAQDPVYREWLQFKKIEAGEADIGAGGIRQLGRFLLMQRAQAFVTEVESLIRQAKTGLGDCPVYVHVFSGMSGGTGAGTFLDVCYLVQRALENQGVGNYKTMGYFFLPDVNLAKDGLPSETRDYIRSNGYASMQELDYCMNLERNGDEWHQVYQGVGEIRTNKPPVEWCHLISATTSRGAVVADAYNYALNVVCDYVMDFLVKPEDTTKPGLESHFSNVGSYKSFVTKDAGAGYDYLVLGAASAVIPFKQVLTYLASGVFAGFENVQARVPTNQEAESFQQRIGFTFDRILQRVLREVDLSFPQPDVKAGDAKDNEKLVVSYFMKMHAAAEGKLETNYQNLSAWPESYAPVEQAATTSGLSLAATVLTEMRSLMADPAFGPAYAAALVQGTAGADLLAACAGIKEEARVRRDHEQFQLDDHLYRQQEQAQNGFRDSNLINRGKFFKQFKNTTRNVYLTQTEVLVYQTVMNLMDTVADQLRRLSREFAVPFRNTMARLFEIFAANRSELSAFADKQNPYEMPLVTMKELMPNLNATLRQLDVPSMARELMGELLTPDGLGGWGPNGDESKLTHIVSRFFIERFSAYSNKSLSNYLKDKYQTDNPQKLAECIYNNLLGVVDSSAAPLFWTQMGYNVDDACAIGYVTVPQTATEVAAAAQMLASAEEDQHLTVRETDVRDRISILRCLVGVPMWGYMGAGQYETEGLSDKRAGLHLYEKAEYVDGVPKVEGGRDWTGWLPSPTPLSMMTAQNDSEVRKRAEEAGALFDRALSAGVVEKTARGYEVRFLTDEFVTEYRAKFDQAKDKPNDVKLDAQAALKSMGENRAYKPNRITLSQEMRAEESLEHVLCKDKLGDAPKLQELIEAELAVYDEMQSDIEALEPQVDRDFETYRKALCTGVIKLDLPLVVYEDKEFGDETVLSKLQMERGGVPLYQAYLSFKELPEETRVQIASEADEILSQDRMPDQVAEACAALKEELANKRDFVAIANEEFPREVADVKELVRNLDDALELFIRRYRIRVK